MWAVANIVGLNADAVATTRAGALAPARFDLFAQSAGLAAWLICGADVLCWCMARAENMRNVVGR